LVQEKYQEDRPVTEVVVTTTTLLMMTTMTVCRKWMFDV
jgi:hypothetical protein